MYKSQHVRSAEAVSAEPFALYRRVVKRRAWKTATALALLIAGAAVGLLVQSALGANAMPRNNLAVGLGTAGLALGVVLYLWGSHDLKAFAQAHPRIDDLHTQAQRQHDTHMLGVGVLVGIALVLAGAALGGALTAPAEQTLGVGLFLLFAAAGIWSFAYVICLAERTAPLGPGTVRRASIDLGDEVRRHGFVGTLCFCVMAASTAVALAMLAVPGDHATYFWLAWAAGGAVCGAIALVTGTLHQPQSSVR